MTTQDNSTLRRLSETGRTVAITDEDVRGRKVKDKDGKTIGKVDDLLVDEREGRVRFLLVEHGGFLGMGETKSFVPVEAITEITDDEVKINHSAGHVAAAPRYDPDLVEDVILDRSYQAGIYNYYGYAPFW